MIVFLQCLCLKQRLAVFIIQPWTLTFYTYIQKFGISKFFLGGGGGINTFFSITFEQLSYIDLSFNLRILKKYMTD